MAPLLLIATGPDGGLQGEHLEPGLQRPVPARPPQSSPASGRRSTTTCRCGRDADPLPDGRATRCGLDDGPGGAEGALRDERDHHDADDVLHRRRPRQPADPGPFQDPAVPIPQTQASSTSTSASADPGHPDPHRRPGRPGAIFVVHFLLTRTASGCGCRSWERTRVRRSTRRQSAPADHHQLPGLGLPRSASPPPWTPRPLGIHPGRPEPGLRGHRHPVRLPRPAEPARRGPLHRLLLGARPSAAPAATNANLPPTSCSCSWG